MPPDVILTNASLPLQNKKANFDASHELEELLLEDNPLKARQRKNQDINNLSAEMRQMEEQCVPLGLFTCTYSSSAIRRFTTYDYNLMRRRSYCPPSGNEEQLVSTGGTSYTGPSSSRPVTPMTIPAAETQDGHKGKEGYDASPVPMHDLSEKTAY